MTAILAWLDTSAEEQRRVRELVAMYAQPESRDELGIGQVRDAFSDGLFPGTSVLQTRARYYLFVPWAYVSGERRHRGQALKAWADKKERELILVLRDDVRLGAGEGLIGRVAGARLKTLPSAVYWSGLVRYGIAQDVATDQLDRSRSDEGSTELAERRTSVWSPTLPQIPAGFPQSITGFDLTYEEASWLSERMQTSASGTLLAHLLQHDALPNPKSGLPWQDPACLAAPAGSRALLEHASLFSTAVHGAALLYNLLVAERYEAAGLDRVPAPVEGYRERLAAWAEDCESYRPQLAAWDRGELWRHVRAVNPRVSERTRAFVESWLRAVTDRSAYGAADDAGLRRLVGDRERRQKGRQSRLENARLLRTWSGAAGTARLAYRWDNVRNIVLDVREGLQRVSA